MKLGSEKNFPGVGGVCVCLCAGVSSFFKRILSETANNTVNNSFADICRAASFNIC